MASLSEKHLKYSMHEGMPYSAEYVAVVREIAGLSSNKTDGDNLARWDECVNVEFVDSESVRDVQ